VGRKHDPFVAAKHAASRARKQAAQVRAAWAWAALQQALRRRARADQCRELHELIDACSRVADMPGRGPPGRPPELLAGASGLLYGEAAARVPTPRIRGACRAQPQASLVTTQGSRYRGTDS
jgi:hypothetical protein